VGRLLLRLRCRPATAAAGAAVMGFAFNPIRLSNEVESYSVCVLLILASFAFYLRIAAPEGAVPARARAAFAVLTSLAIGFHYFAGLYLAACAIAPGVVAALRPAYRRAMAARLPSRWKADVATLFPPFAVGAYLYEVQARIWVMPLSSLPSFYFRRGQEAASSFLVRNLRETFNLFAPVALSRARFALPLLALFLLAAAWPLAADRREGPPAAARLFPLTLLAILVGAEMVLGLSGLYPFGGQMRHQFLIFLFALLGGMVAMDAATGRLSAVGRRVALGSLGVILATDFLVQLPALLHPAPDRLRPILEARDADFRAVGRVSVDQFGLVGLFTHYYGGEFRFVERLSESPLIQRYRIGSGQSGFEVLEFRDSWIFNFDERRVFDELAGTWSRQGAGCEGLFRVAGTIFDKPVRQEVGDLFRSALERRLLTAATAHGLDVRKLDISGFLDVFAELCPAGR
jgi:hypothetical protein